MNLGPPTPTDQGPKATDLAADLSDVIARMHRLSKHLNILVLLAAHFGKDEGRGIRGWSGQTGAADLILTVQRDKEEPELRLLTADKVKDGEDGDRFAFRLAGVSLGEDEDGETITSATPAFEPAPLRRRLPRPLNTAEELALKAVKLVTDHGPHHPAPAMPGVPSSVKALARCDVKARAMDCGFAAPEEKPNTVSARFSRALQGLAAKGRVRIEGEWVWWV
ncbi:MAG: putative primase [Caulobacteraceae bacterium]|nr:putative primase [Caulobacteraceae bacterium]